MRLVLACTATSSATAPINSSLASSVDILEMLDGSSVLSLPNDQGSTKDESR
jgi:hypothetical protein